MADDDDDVRGAVSPEELFAPTGPRRSNFTPAPTDAEALEAAANVFNDDAIAAALAAELHRMASGPIPIQRPAQNQPAEPAFTPAASAEPEPAAPVGADPVSADPVFAAPVSATPVPPAPVSAAPVSASPVSAAPVVPEPAAPEPVAPEPVAPEPVPEPPTESVPSGPPSWPTVAPTPPAGSPMPTQQSAPPEWASPLFGQPTVPAAAVQPTPPVDPYAPGSDPFAPPGPSFLPPPAFPPAGVPAVATEPAVADATPTIAASPIPTVSPAAASENERRLLQGAAPPSVPAADAPPPPGYGVPAFGAPGSSEPPENDLPRTFGNDAPSGTGDTLSAIEQLQAQLEQRDRDAQARAASVPSPPQPPAPNDEPFAMPAPSVDEPFANLLAPTDEPFSDLAAPADEPFTDLAPPANEPFTNLPAPSDDLLGSPIPPVSEPFGGMAPPAEEPYSGMAPPSDEPFAAMAPPTDAPAVQLAPPTEEPTFQLPPPLEEPAVQLPPPPFGGDAVQLPPPPADAPFGVPSPQAAPFPGFGAPVDAPPPVDTDIPVFLEPPTANAPAPASPPELVEPPAPVGLESPAPTATSAPFPFAVRPAATDPVVSAPPPAQPPVTATPLAQPQAASGGFDDLLVGSGQPNPKQPSTVFMAAAPDPDTPDEGEGEDHRPFGSGVERDDAVDPSDSIFGAPGPVSVNTAGVAVLAEPISLESRPILVQRPEPELEEPAPRAPHVFDTEVAGAESTPLQQRIGRSTRLFWLWFAVNPSIAGVVFGALILGLGMSLRWAIIATLIGIALSFIPLGLGVLAGKRSGQPTMVVSRATFGLVGNILPASIALLSRLFWAAALLWIIGAGSAEILVGARLTDGFSQAQLTVIVIALAFIVAVVIAWFGYAFIALVQLIVTVISAIAIAGFIVLTVRYLDIPTALTIPDGPIILVVTGAVLVFSFVGLAWANSSSDLARYQGQGTSGPASMILATIGTTLPSFVLIGYGALLAASNSELASNIARDPMDALGRLLPVWYPVPFLAATALSLLSGVIVSMYSGGFALQAIGLRVRRSASTLIVGVLVIAIAVAVATSVTDFGGLFRDFATTVAVPVAAWAGIFAAETMIRNRRYHAESLLRRGGIYPDVNWPNLIALVLITAIGFGLSSATVPWLSWEGYLWSAVGVPPQGLLGASDLGVVVALLLGLVVPGIIGVRAIRRQEGAAPPAE